MASNERIRRSIEFQYGVNAEDLIKGTTIAENSIEGLEAKLQTLKGEFATVEIGSQRFNELGNEIQATSSKLKTLDERFEGLGAEQKGAAIVDAFNAVTGAVSAVGGALVVLGVESEALEDVEKRLLGLIAIVTGLEAVSKGIQAIIKLWPSVVAGATKATAAVRAFALANPFTAIAAGVVALTVAIGALIKSQDNEEKSLEKLDTARKDYEKQLDAESAARIRLLKAQGANNEQIQKEIILDAKRAKETADNNLQRALSENRFSEATQEARTAAINAANALKEAEAELETIQRESREQEAEFSRKAAEDRKKEAEDKKQKAEEEKKRLEELRVARLQSAQEGAEGLFAIEQELNQSLRDLRLKEIEEGLGAFALFTIDEETLELVRGDLIEKEGILRETRLKELDKTTAALLKQNEDYFAKVIEGLGFGTEEYLAEEKKFQAIRTAILAADSEARRKITNEETNQIFNANFKLAAMLNELAKGEGAKLLAVEDQTYKQRKDAVIKYYDAVIAAAKAANLSVVELERQKNDALKGLDEGRKKDLLDGLRTTLGAFGTFLSQQRDIIDSQLQADLLALGNNESAKEALREQAFEKQKKLRIAEATISGITGAIDAFNSVQNLNKIVPGLGIAVGLGLAGLVAGITAQQIGLISNSSLNGPTVSGTGFQNIPSSGGFSLPGGGGVPAGGSQGAVLPGLGGGRLGAPTIGTIGQEPIRAYVLAGDVENGVQANIALNNRRRLAG